MNGSPNNVIGFPGAGSAAAGATPGAVPPPGGAPPAPSAAPPGVAPAPAAAGMPGGPGAPPAVGAPTGFTLNPAFQQWQQLSQWWHAETNRRRMQFLQACHLIRHDVAFGYKIDIEADSTIAADEQAEKASRTEFLTSIMPMLQMIIPEVQQNPAVAPLAQALVMFGVRAFPAARSLEEDFEKAFAQLASANPQPPAGRGNVKQPAEIASEERIAQGSQNVDMAKVQVDAQKNQVDLAKAYLQLQADQAKQTQDGQMRQLELVQQQAEAQAKAQLDQARIEQMANRSIPGLV